MVRATLSSLETDKVQLWIVMLRPADLVTSLVAKAQMPPEQTAHMFNGMVDIAIAPNM